MQAPPQGCAASSSRGVVASDQAVASGSALDPLNLAEIPESTLSAFLSPRLFKPLVAEDELMRAMAAAGSSSSNGAVGIDGRISPSGSSGALRMYNWKRTHWANRGAAAETIKKLLNESGEEEIVVASSTSTNNNDDGEEHQQQSATDQVSTTDTLQISSESGLWKRTHWLDKDAAAEAIKKLVAESNSGAITLNDSAVDEDDNEPSGDYLATEGWRHRHWADKETAVEAIRKLIAEDDRPEVVSSQCERQPEKPQHVVEIRVIAAQDLKTSSKDFGTLDAFCKLSLVGSEQKLKTKTIKCSGNPRWDEVFRFEVDSLEGEVYISCWSKKVGKRSRMLGEVVLPTLSVLVDVSTKQEGWLPLTCKDDGQDLAQGMLSVSMHLTTTIHGSSTTTSSTTTSSAGGTTAAATTCAGNVFASSASSVPLKRCASASARLKREDFGPTHMRGWLTKMNTGCKRYFVLTDKVLLYERDNDEQKREVIYLDSILRIRCLPVDNSKTTLKGGSRFIAGMKKRGPKTGSGFRKKPVLVKRDSLIGDSSPIWGTEPKSFESSPAFSIRTQQDKLYFLMAENSTVAALWMLAISGMLKKRLCFGGALDDKEKLLQYVHYEGFKGGVVKSSPSIEQWQYSKGVLTREWGELEKHNISISYLWNGESLVPKEGSVNYGYGKWNGVWLGWFDDQHTLVPNTQYKWCLRDREYCSSDEKHTTWKWTRHFLAAKNGEEDHEWIKEGEVPEILVMFLQLLHMVRRRACSNSNSINDKELATSETGGNNIETVNTSHSGSDKIRAQSDAESRRPNPSVGSNGNTSDSASSSVSNTNSEADISVNEAPTTSGPTPAGGAAEAGAVDDVDLAKSNELSASGKMARRVRVKKPKMSNRWRDFYLEALDDGSTSSTGTPGSSSDDLLAVENAAKKE